VHGSVSEKAGFKPEKNSIKRISICKLISNAEIEFAV